MAASELILPRRIAGINRFATSAAISQATFESAGTAVIANGEGFADALTASGLAGATNAPVLLVRRDSVPEEVMTELRRLSVEHVYLVGGASAISTAVEETIEQEGASTSRLAGRDRYETAALVAQEIEEIAGPIEHAYVATGLSFADAIAVSPLAYVSQQPILLTQTSELPEETLEVLDRMGSISSATLIGGTAVIESAVVDQLTDLGIASRRVSGETRFDTAVRVATIAVEEMPFNFDSVVFANGNTFADSLAGAAYSGRSGSPLFLSAKTLAPEVAAALRMHESEVQEVSYLGGVAAIADVTTYQIGLALDLDAKLLRNGGLLTLFRKGTRSDNEPPAFPSLVDPHSGQIFADVPYSWSDPSGLQGQFSFSADGSQFLANELIAGTRTEVIIDVTSGSINAVASGSGGWWSAVGDRIFYFDPDSNLYVYDVAAAKSNAVPGAISRVLASLPDGDHVVVPDEAEPNDRLWHIVNVNDGSRVSSVEAANFESTQSVDSSPDGKHLVYVCRSEFIPDICIVATDGETPPRIIGKAELNVTGPVWSPDGSTIAYLETSSSGDAHLVTMHVDGSNRKRMRINTTDGYSSNLPLDWQPLPI